MATPQPVIVKNWPPADVTSLHWAQAGVLVSVLTAFVALVTLFFVWRQIVLAQRALEVANQELDLTNATLGLTREELDLTKRSLDATIQSNDMVRESLEYAREQAQRLERRAKLEVFTISPVVGMPPATNSYVEIYVVNRGDKVATSAVLRMLLPVGVSIVGAGTGWRVLPQWNAGKILYNVYERDVTQFIPPRCLVQVNRMTLNIGGLVQHDFLYQIMYDDGVTPEDGSATRLPSRDEVDPNGLIVGLPPR